jgi:membrane-bound metal-dependent hydrolase YbcI (DUF457 family)
MFAVGHFALGYLAGKGSSRFLKVGVNLPLLLTVSVLPDIDLFLRFLHHRGPTHSLITFTVCMLPFFVVYRKQAVPYFGALLSHSLIGDYFTGGVQLFWPVSQGWFVAGNLKVTSLLSVSIELALFVVSLVIMFRLGELQTLLRPGHHNLALIVAFGAVVGPVFAAVMWPLLQMGQGLEKNLPALLVIPSLFYAGLFAYSMIVKLQARHKRSKPN